MFVADDSLTQAVLTIGDVLAQYGDEWQIEKGDFCLIAVRRPTPITQEIVTGRDARELATKLAAEGPTSGGSWAPGQGAGP